MNVNQKLMQVQTLLKAPKGQFNSFGKYKYRSCEDILEALKPLLSEVKATLTLTDRVLQIGERFYIEATATFTDVEKQESISVCALAREDDSKKGMDLAQVTGSVSSYSRKYSLNGLFLIDDTKDSDSTNTHGKGTSTEDLKELDNVVHTITKDEAKNLLEVASKASVTAATVTKQLLAKFKLSLPSQLNKDQYDIMIKGYENMVKGAK